MAEELYLEVKTNIGQATKDTKEYKKSLEQVNEEISLQNEYIIAQEKELIKLKSQQDAIPKGAWVAGMDSLNDKIRETTAELKDEKNGLKDLKREQKEVTKAIRDKTSAQKKDTNSAIRGIQHFQVMGVSIRSIKNMLRGVIPMFKLLFGTIRAGIASTGIGLLLLAIVSIGTSMKKSAAGAKGFKIMMESIGAITETITDSLIFLGDTMLSVFGIDSNTSVAVTAAEQLEKAYKDLGKQMDDINLKDAKNGRLKLKNQTIIDDETLSEKQRIAKVRENWEIEREVGRDKLHNLQDINSAQKTALGQAAQDIYVAEQSGKVTDDLIEKQNDLLKAQKKTATDIANLKTLRLQQEIDLADTITKIKQTQIDADNAAHKAELARFQEIRDAEEKRFEGIEKLVDKRIELIEKLAKAEDINFEKKKTIELSLQELSEKRIEWAAMNDNERLNLAKNTLNDLTKIAGEETATGRALAITATTIDTFQSAQASYKSLAGIPVIGPALGGIAAAAAVAMGLKNIAAIRGANSSGGGGGGGNISAPNTSTPAPQMMSGAFDISGGVAPEASKAYVVTDEMSNSQNQLANIRRRATI